MTEAATVETPTPTKTAIKVFVYNKQRAEWTIFQEGMSIEFSQLAPKEVREAAQQHKVDVVQYANGIASPVKGDTADKYVDAAKASRAVAMLQNSSLTLTSADLQAAHEEGRLQEREERTKVVGWAAFGALLVGIVFGASLS